MSTTILYEDWETSLHLFLISNNTDNEKINLAQILIDCLRSEGLIDLNEKFFLSHVLFILQTFLCLGDERMFRKAFNLIKERYENKLKVSDGTKLEVKINHESEEARELMMVIFNKVFHEYKTKLVDSTTLNVLKDKLKQFKYVSEDVRNKQQDIISI